MRKMFAVAVLSLLVTGSFVTAEAATLVSSMAASNIAGSQAPPNYGLRLDGFFDDNAAHEVTFGFDNVFFDVFDDGSARLHGFVDVLEWDPLTTGAYNARFAMNVDFQEITDSSGISNYKPSWNYYELIDSPGHEMVNVANANDYVDLFMFPSDGRKPFRTGIGANGKNNEFGAAGWLNYVHTVNGHTTGDKYSHYYSSDFLMNLEESDLPPDPIPEPGTLALLGLGLLGGAKRLARKKK